MATPKVQRVGIWVITIVMVVGVIGSFAVMILSSQNQSQEDAAQQKALDEYQKQLKKQQQEASELSTKYYPTLKKYKNTPTQFDPTTVGKKVTKHDLIAGKGSVIEKGDNYKAYYIGWNPDGKTFDSSFSSDGNSLNEPIDTTQGSGLIKGWSEGVIGMKVGGVRELTIPSDLAYGKSGQGDDIPANTPLKFIVYIIKKD